MKPTEHLGNMFSDEDSEENSFDAPAVENQNMEMNNDSFGTEDEEEEEFIAEQTELDLEEDDFNILTIEEVSMEVLTSRMGRVMTEVIQRGEHAAIALFEVANKIVFQSTMLDAKNNKVIATIIYGISRLFFDGRERDLGAEQAEHVIILFITKLAIKNKSMKCCDLLYQLILFVDRLYFHTDSFVRVRIYRLLACLVEESNRYADVMRENGDNLFYFTDEDIPETEEMIPIGVKTDGCQIWLVVYWINLHKVTAARRIHIVDEKEIDKCIDYIEISQDNKVKQAIIIRLASDVHLSSFTEKQRFRLVNLLNTSDSARVQDIIHQRLVESWMKVAGKEFVSPSIFPPPEPTNMIPNQFPSIIIQYLNPFEDPIAVYIFMKATINRFICQTVGDKDVEQFMKHLLGLSHKDTESVGLMRRTTFRLITEDSNPEIELKKTFVRILISRCFVDVVMNESKGRLDANHLHQRVLMFFLPDVTNFVQQLKSFCSVYFEADQTVSYDNCKELLLYNIIHLLNVAVRYGDAADDKYVYKQALTDLLENPLLEFSTETLMTMTTMCLDLCQTEEDRYEYCDWICGISTKLMINELNGKDEKASNLKNAIENKSISDRMYLRSATMLLSTCQHEEVKKPTNEMTVLFQAIIPALLGSVNKHLQKIGLELIGYATSIDFLNNGPYLKLTSFLLQRDDEVLKSTGIHSLVRVIQTHGFPDTASAIFGDEEKGPESYQNSLPKLFEKSIISLQGMALVQTVQDCLSMLSYGSYAWPKLLCTILLVSFQKCNENLPLVKILRTYCKSVRSTFNKINILNGFTKAVDVISKTNEHDSSWKIYQMTELVCEYLSSVMTIEDDDEAVHQEEAIYMEVELTNRMISKALSRPSAWYIRHVFTAMATSLQLEYVPMEKLDKLHESLVDSYDTIRCNSGKATQIAFKRFLTHCERVITLHEKIKGLKINFDLKKVKNEAEELDSRAACSSSSSSSRKKKRTRDCWDDDDEENIASDDSFEYYPKPTRTRKRVNSSPIETSAKVSRVSVEREEVPHEESNIDDSFEL
uniref:Condensin complex subunit 3 n=1 Tax=Caenorhabditis tropicalis TaxID=1561998 RepID=A0A1I7T750_9PELO